MSLEESPEQGVKLGKDCFKIRLSIASKGKGKSGGARIITHIYFSGKKIFLLSIYDKSERTDIAATEIASILKIIFEN